MLDNTLHTELIELTELMLNIPLNTKQVISGMLFPANVFTSTEKKSKTRKNNHENKKTRQHNN